MSSCNPASERIFGREKASLAGVELVSLCHVLDRGALGHMLSEVREGRVPARQEIRFRRPDGDEVVTGFSVAPTRRKGAVMVCVLRDLSREKAFRPQLLHTERMASIGMVASVVAHELNNALTGALGCLQLLPERGEVSEQELVGSVMGELRRAAEIVRELKGYARVEQGMTDRIRVTEVTSRLERLRRFHAPGEEPVALQLEVDDELPEIVGSANQLLQALLNLVRNAEQAVADLPPERRIVRIRGRASAQTLVLEVIDRGPGVPEEARGRLFEPFYSTKAAGEGTGLGLAVVQAVAAAHGGRVEIDDTPGGGATFRLVMPCERAPAEPRSSEPAASPRTRYARLRGLRLLVADDEMLIRRVVHRCCALHGIDVVEAVDATQARELLGEQDFDLVLLDVRMPGGGGAAAFRAIRKSHPHLVARTLFMSGDISTDMAQLVGTGHGGVLPKPFDLNALLETLDEVLGGLEGGAPGAA